MLLTLNLCLSSHSTSFLILYYIYLGRFIRKPTKMILYYIIDSIDAQLVMIFCSLFLCMFRLFIQKYIDYAHRLCTFINSLKHNTTQHLKKISQGDFLTIEKSIVPIISMKICITLQHPQSGIH